MSVRIMVGDCRTLLRTLEPKSVHTIAFSPPYWGLRDYQIPPSVWGGDPDCKHRFAKKPVRTVTIERGFCRCGAWRGCFGLEPTYQLYIEHMVEIGRELWRVLRDDGTMWVNMGDCYANSRAGWSAQRYMDEERDDRTFRDKPFNTFTRKAKHKSGGAAATNNGERTVDWGYRSRALDGSDDGKGRSTPTRADGSGGGDYYGLDFQPNRMPQRGLKQKDLAGIPWRVAFALQDDGWWLRRDIIWAKKNPMPESTYDRPTTAHEYLFLFSKSGDTLCWRHEDGRWTWEKPAPDYRWRHRVTRDVVSVDPQNDKEWFRFNLWRGFDYYYDFAAIMEPTSPDSHARAARSRSKEHKHSNGSDLSGKPHGIAIGPPSAGRYPTPAGWDEGEGHHGDLHRDGRRQEVGIGHNGRPSKAVPNGAAGRRALPAEWKQGGPNSRFHKDRVPRERKADAHAGTYASPDGPRPKNNANFDLHLGSADLLPMRNKRSVWSIATKPFKEAHFATFPPDLIRPCILAGCPKGGTVLDPFAGAGTTGLVSDEEGRNSILIEINPKYAAMAERRIAKQRMGPEEKKRHAIKSSGKLKPPKGLPLFSSTKAKAVTRDGAKERA